MNTEEALHRRFKDKMDTLIIHYPDDLEAKMFLALSMMGDERMGADRLLQDVLAKAPDHPGAHHYRIHNWNYHEPEFALDSCRRYGEIAWDTGHALHMPGHNYSTIGMWQEAAIALAGLVRAHAALGDMDKAREAMGRLLYIWSDADKGLKPLELALATGVKAEPKAVVAAPERNYAKLSLAKFGPNRWAPYAAPLLDAVDVDGKRVSLQDYKGKNVLLVFYLGDECTHCMLQLNDLGKRKKDFDREDTVVLAISRKSSQENKKSLKLGEIPFRLLSDGKLENMERWKSYDDFEGLELHSTILVDKQGRVDWARSGGDPFTDFDFLLKEIHRP